MRKITANTCVYILIISFLVINSCNLLHAQEQFVSKVISDLNSSLPSDLKTCIQKGKKENKPCSLKKNKVNFSTI